MKGAVDQAGAQDDPVTFTGKSMARGEDGVVASVFEVTWSFKRRATLL
jgi:hypothetical protein